MKRGKKKTKKKLNFGGSTLQEKGPLQSSVTQGAGAIPLWGQLAQMTAGAAEGIRGDGTNGGANAFANSFDPASAGMRAIDQGNYKLAARTFLDPIGGGFASVKGAKTANAKAALQAQAANDYDLVRYNYGGMLKKKLGLVGGGNLQPISTDAVEVKANNPAMTDSVELEGAFVDNNEIIDNKDRVFSDEITADSGRTVAKEAKRLEKMKSVNPRFGSFNDMIDGKLNDLFSYQEQVKKDATVVDNGMAKFRASGGKRVTSDPVLGLVDSAIEDERKSIMPNRLNLLRATAKKKLAPGGYLEDPKPGKPRYDGNPMFSSADLMQQQPTNVTGGQQFDWFQQDQQMPDFSNYNWNNQSGKSKFNWGQAATTAATFGSNMVNQFLISKLKGPARPINESQISLPRLTPNAQLGEIAAGFRGAQKVVNSNVPQSSNLVSATGSLLAKRMSATNQAIDSVNRANAGIETNEKSMNVGINARNVGRTNQFNDNYTQFKNKKLQLTSQNVANASEKAMMMSREKNIKDRDMLELQLIKQSYGDSGVYDRALAKYLDAYFKKKGMKKS